VNLCDFEGGPRPGWTFSWKKQISVFPTGFYRNIGNIGRTRVAEVGCANRSPPSFCGFGVAQEGNGVYLVPVFGRAQVRFQTFDEGTGNEMLPRFEVVYILTGADVYQGS
jgi:hypothetical protein